MTDTNETLRAKAVSLLNKLGIRKEEILPSIWKSFKAQTIQLIANGYRERFIELKLLELAKVRATTYALRPRVLNKFDYVGTNGVISTRTKSDKRKRA